MDQQRAKTASRTHMNSRYVTISSDGATTNDNDQQATRDSLKITVSTQQGQPGKHSQNRHQSAKSENRNEQQSSGISLLNRFSSFHLRLYYYSARQK